MSRFVRTAAAVAAVLLLAAPAFADVCDPADPNADPNCADPGANGNNGNNGGGPTCVYADECGTTDSCGYADECGSAGHCDYADVCGDAETCDVADICASADHAQTCDDAAYADTCDEAAVADLALGVAECVSGVWGVGGESAPNCGDLRYDGRVGINTTPAAALDVAGTVALRGAADQVGLVVAADGNVGIGTDTPERALDVDGIVLADAVELTARPGSTTVLPSTNCRGAIDWLQPSGSASFDPSMVCSVPLPAGAVLTEVECRVEGDMEVALIQRDATFAVEGNWAEQVAGESYTTIQATGAPAVGPGGSVQITFESTTSASLFGCVVRYEDVRWF